MTERLPVYFLVKSSKKMLVNCCICRRKLADYDKSAILCLENLCYFYHGKPTIL